MPQTAVGIKSTRWRSRDEQLTADRLVIAAVEDERQRPHDDFRSANKRHRNNRGV
jgi:hypothetical protein